LSNQEDHLSREAAVLALGAISEQEGAYDHICKHLSSILPVLFKFLEDEFDRIKCTTCWTLSKFSYYIAGLEVEDINAYVFKICELMKNKNEEVQEAS